MGVKKSRKKSKKSSVFSKAKDFISSKVSKSSGGVRHRRVTPEKLAKQILILKLKRKLFKLKYGGR